MRRPPVSTVFAVLAIAFFAAPLALVIAGVRADAFENRRLAEAPSLADGWDFFDGATRYLVDHMPLREEAVRANTWIVENIFDTTPKYGGDAGDDAVAGLAEGGNGQQDQSGQSAAPEKPPPETAAQVLRGESGWLYLQGEIDRACQPFLPFSDALARWQELVSIVRESGRPAIMVIPPDKTAIYPDYLPGDLPTRECLRAANTQLRKLVAAGGDGVFGLFGALDAAKARSETPVYKRKDSHWTDVGALTLVRTVLEQLGGKVRLKPGEIVDAGTAEYTGDLTVLLGAPETDTAPVRQVQREPDAPKIPGTTLFVYDSYGDAPLPLMQPYFAKVETVLWDGSSPEQLVAAIKGADRVIFESVEREFTFRASDAGYVHPTLFHALRAAL